MPLIFSVSSKRPAHACARLLASMLTLAAGMIAPGMIVFGMIVFGSAPPVHAQSSAAIRITDPVDNAARVTLKGNVHPLARAQYDHGAAPLNLPANRLTLVLKRSPQQETALRQFLESLQDKKSPLYHKYLTPEQFGKQYGPADADLQTIKNWLGSQGFSIAKVNKGRTQIEFSGTVEQVQKAFQTTIHSYVVKGEQHYANATDPKIPAALAPVVAGVARLNNFKAHSLIKVLGTASLNRSTHKAKPLFNDPSFNGDGTLAGYYLAVEPGDLSVLYDTKPLLTAGTDGTGVTIAIAGDSNVDPSFVQNFRTNFLPAYSPTAFSLSNIIIDGNDPGINGDSGEAYLDIETAGGVAPNATVNFYTASDTNLSGGLELAIARAIDDNTAQILNISFGAWEGAIGAVGNQSISDDYEQAAAQGITVLVSAGDSGSAAADDPDTEAVAVNGLQVSGFASTPFNIAVGGTDFTYPQNVTAAELDAYWNAATQTNPNNNADFSSALSYIPEQPWNDSNPALNQPNSGFQANIVAGGGGASNCAASITNPDNSVTCQGGYAKPSWQVGAGVPADTVRDLPDVSLFAANGANFSFYGICAGTSDAGVDDCSANGGPNSLTDPIQITGVGGTSASSPAMAGIMALVVQKYGAQGQAGTVLYPLATQQPTAFHDITVGNNAVGCTPGTSLDCGSNGYLTGYAATAGYDQASGLGSVDANVLVSKWNSVVTTPTTTTLTVTPTTVTLNDPVTFTVTVTGAGGTPTGDVAILTNSTSTGEGGQTTVTLGAGTNTATFSYTGLPGSGNPAVPYQVTARYAGDGIFASSTSTPTTMTVTPVASQITTSNADVYSVVNNQFVGTPNLSANAAVPYGSYIGYDSTPIPAVASTSPTSAVIARGTIKITDNSAAVSTLSLDSNGVATVFNPSPAVGAHSIVATYSGDVSYLASSTSAAPLTFTVVKAATALTSTTSSATIAAGQTLTLTATLASTSFGVVPTGTVVFNNGTTPLTGAVTFTGGYDPNTGYALATATATESFSAFAPGANTITAVYSGDGNYATASAAPVTITSSGVPATPDFTVAAAAISFASGTAPSGTSAVTIGQANASLFAGTVTFGACTLSAGFTGGSCSIAPGSVTLSSGVPSTTATVTVSSATTTASERHQNQPRWLATGGGLALAAVLFFGIPARRRSWRSMLAAVFCLAAAVGMGACGGGGSTKPTIPPGGYTATVTATSGALSHVITVNITVN